MFKDWLKSTQALLIRLRINETNAVFRPRFAMTSLVLWIIALSGLIYGHLVKIESESGSISLLLSGVAAGGALLLLLLHDPKQRFLLYTRQVGSLLVLVLFGLLLGITYLIAKSDSTSVIVVVTWLAASVLVGVTGLRLSVKTYTEPQQTAGDSYPGLRSAPIFMVLFVVNILIWMLRDLI